MDQILSSPTKISSSTLNPQTWYLSPSPNRFLNGKSSPLSNLHPCPRIGGACYAWSKPLDHASDGSNLKSCISAMNDSRSSISRPLPRWNSSRWMHGPTAQIVHNTHPGLTGIQDPCPKKNWWHKVQSWGQSITVRDLRV